MLPWATTRKTHAGLGQINNSLVDTKHMHLIIALWSYFSWDRILHLNGKLKQNRNNSNKHFSSFYSCFELSFKFGHLLQYIKIIYLVPRSGQTGLCVNNTSLMFRNSFYSFLKKENSSSIGKEIHCERSKKTPKNFWKDSKIQENRFATIDERDSVITVGICMNQFLVFQQKQQIGDLYTFCIFPQKFFTNS